MCFLIDFGYQKTYKGYFLITVSIKNSGYTFSVRLYLIFSKRIPALPSCKRPIYQTFN